LREFYRSNAREKVSLNELLGAALRA
jgi:hypothetical protein